MTLNREHCTPNEPGPSKIIDAEGREIPHVIRANTVTGEVVQLDVNAFGMTRPDNDGEQCARVTRRYPAPLAFIPLLLALCFNVFAETTAERLDDGIPAASSAITPTKGSLWVANGTAFIPLAVGTNAQILQADSTATNGIKWAAAGGVDTTANFTWTGTHTFDLVQIWKQSATPSTPAATYYKLYFKSDGKLYKINSAGTEAEVGAGGVTSVATGNGLSGGPITGAGTIDLRLDVNGTLSKTLGAGSNEVGIASGGVGTTQLAASGVTYAKLQDVAGLSVVGRSANTSGVSAAITATATGQVLRYAGTTLAFGALDLTDSDAVSGILPSTYGGTGNGFTKFSGPAGTEKTFTLPNASAAVLTDNAAVTVAQGGTGVATLTAYAPIFGGTTATGAVQSGAVGTAGDVLTSNGAGSIATFQTLASAPFTDTTALVKGSGDATKKLRIEADGITTSTTRVWTAPDADTSIPVFSYTATFTGPTAPRTYTLPDANKTLLATDGSGASLTALSADNISAGTLAAARGGTGVSNAGTITNASNTTITGGGTIALGGFTQTIGSSGTTVNHLTNFCSPVDFAATATAASANAGNFTVGNKFVFTSACTITHFRIYYPDSTSRSIKFQIWDSTNASVYNQTNTIAAAGITNVALTTPYSASAWTHYTISMWDTAGAVGGKYFVNMLSQSVIVFARDYFFAGDAFPATSTGNELYPIEPKITVP